MKSSRVVRKIRGIAVVTLLFTLLTGLFATGVAGAAPAGTSSGDTLVTGQGQGQGQGQDLGQGQGLGLGLGLGQGLGQGLGNNLGNGRGATGGQPAMTDEEKAKLESLKGLVKQAQAELDSANDKATAGDSAGAVADVRSYFGVVEEIASQITLPAPRWSHAIANALRRQGNELVSIYQALSQQGRDDFKAVIMEERDKAKDSPALALVLGALAKVVRNQDGEKKEALIARLEKQLAEAKQTVERIQNHISRLAKTEAALSEKIAGMRDGALKDFAQRHLHLVQLEMDAAAKALEAAQYKVSLLNDMLDYHRSR